MRKHFVVHLRALERFRVKAGDHAREVLQVAHVLELRHLVEIIAEREFVRAQLFGRFKRFLLVKALLRLFDKR